MKDKILYLFYDRNELPDDFTDEPKDEDILEYLYMNNDSIIIIGEDDYKNTEPDLNEYTNYLKLKVVEDGFIKKEFSLNPNATNTKKKKKMVK